MRINFMELFESDGHLIIDKKMSVCELYGRYRRNRVFIYSK